MILYFSGTGNSKLLAEIVADSVGDELVSMNDLIKQQEVLDVSDEKRLVFVVPTYAWRIPRVVEYYIETQIKTKGQSVYFVMNCGEDIGNADKYLKRLCKGKNLKYMGVTGIKMPENYIALYDCPSVSESIEIVEAAKMTLKKIIDCIQKNEVITGEVSSFGGKFNSAVINPLFYKFFVKDKKFKVKKGCIGCGKCEKVCPLNNIEIQQNQPIWKHNCTHCMACICNCPTEAIEYGKISEGKRRYLCPEKEC